MLTNMAQILFKHKLKLHYIIVVTVCLQTYSWFNKRISHLAA